MRKTRKELAEAIEKDGKPELRAQYVTKNIFTHDHASRMRTREGHAYARFHSRKGHAKKKGIPFEITLEHVISIIPEKCPILGIVLAWCEHQGKPQDNSPSLDRINPDKGYIVGNVAWISNKANTIKNAGTAEEHQKIADWMKKQHPANPHR